MSSIHFDPRLLVALSLIWLPMGCSTKEAPPAPTSGSTAQQTHPAPPTPSLPLGRWRSSYPNRVALQIAGRGKLQLAISGQARNPIVLVATTTKVRPRATATQSRVFRFELTISSLRSKRLARGRRWSEGPWPKVTLLGQELRRGSRLSAELRVAGTRGETIQLCASHDERSAHAPPNASRCLKLSGEEGRWKRVHFCGKAHSPKNPFISCKDRTLSDLSPLRHFSRLESLQLNGTNITDLRPLIQHRIQRLSLRGIPATDFAPLSRCRFLEDLSLSRTRIVDLEPIAKLKALRRLVVGWTQVSNIHPLSKLTALEFLFIANTRVTNLAPLRNAKKLKVLNLNETAVRDLTPIAELPALQELYCHRCRRLSSLPNFQLPRLRKLYLSATRVRDLRGLAKLTSLKSLYLAGTAVRDLKPLHGLRQLQMVKLNNTNVTPSELAALKKANPKLEIVND